MQRTMGSGALGCAALLLGGLSASVALADEGAEILPGLPSGPAVSSPLPAVSQTIPVYSSLPGAAARIYLDFGGDTRTFWENYTPTVTPPYSTDSDTSSFSASELSNIHEIWSRVAEAFSPFKIDVTTAAPGSLANGVGMRVIIGGDGKIPSSDPNAEPTYWTGPRAGGIAYVNSFTSFRDNSAYVFSGNLANGVPKYTAMAVAHEVGHTFGLEHQSSYDGFGNKVSEYNRGTDARAPLMGSSYFATRGVWNVGRNGLGANQSDVDIISSLANGFGYRDDDHGNSIQTATPLTMIGNQAFGSGVIEMISDADHFTFTIGQESEALFSVTGAAFGAMLDPSLALYSLDGSLLQLAATTSLTESLAATLLPGTYDLAVLSAGVAGDIGQFSLAGTITPVPEPTVLLMTAVAGILLLRRRQC